MGRLWEFLRNEQNRLVLGWLGGGLVVAATGAWAAFIYFFPAHKSPESSPVQSPATVRASCGGIAIGGNVSGTTITAGSQTNAECATKSK